MKIELASPSWAEPGPFAFDHATPPSVGIRMTVDQGTARLVGRVMSSYGDDAVPWWRVLRADGTCASEVADRQIPLLEADGVAWLVPKHRVDMSVARWNPPGRQR